MSTSASPTTPQPSGRPGRYQRSFGGLVGSMIALFALALGLWLITRFMSDSEPVRLHAIEYAQPLEQARRDAPFRVLAPAPVPDGWRATSVDYQAAGPVRTWSLGFHDEPGTHYVGLTQSNGSADQVIDDATPADVPAGQMTVSGQRWMVMTSDHETALVLSKPHETVVVTGTAPRQVLVGFVSSLR